MTTSHITINGNIIIDEAASVQNTTDDSDNEVAWSTLYNNYQAGDLVLTELQALKSSTQTTLVPSSGESAGDTTVQWPQVSEQTIGTTSSNFIQVDATVTNLSFSDQSKLPINDGTLATGIFATHNGAQIFLYESADGNIVLGREGSWDPNTSTWVAASNGTVAFALVLDETMTGGKVTGGNFWVIQYEALQHSSASGVDDADMKTLSGLVDIKADFVETSSSNFGDFSHVPSGQDAWAAIEQTGTAGTDTSSHDIIVSGLVPSSTVNVSTTGLGNNSQAVDPGEGVRIDFVHDVTYPDFPLTNKDVHDQSKIKYDVHETAITEASFSLTQVNPAKAGSTVTVQIYAFNETSDLQGASLFSSTSVGTTGLSGTDETKVPIVFGSIKVWDHQVNPATTADQPLDLNAAGIVATQQSDGSYLITGLKVNYTVDFQVAASDGMDRFVVTNAGSNSFDIGNISGSVGTSTPGSEATDIGGSVVFEDGGPVAPTATAAASVTHDETPGVQTAADPNASNDVASGSLPTAILSLFDAIGSARGSDADVLVKDDGAIGFAAGTSSLVTLSGGAFGADGPATSGSVAYSLSVTDATYSGLSTTEGTEIFLYNGTGDLAGLILGRVGTEAGANDTANASGTVAFALTVDADGKGYIAQYLSLNHGAGGSDSAAYDNEISIASSALKLIVTYKDGDGDTASSTPLSVGQLFKFQDDGPTITINDTDLNYFGTTATYSTGAHGTWSDAPGSDGLQSLSVTFDDFKIDGAATPTATTATNSTFKQGDDYFHYSGSITADFNGDGVNDTVSFALAFNNNGTYDLSVTSPPTSTHIFSTANGQLDAGGPDPVRTLTVTATDGSTEQLVFGAVKESDSASGIEGVLNQGEAYFQSQTSLLSSAAMNVSTSGIGLGNNLFEGNAESGVDALVDKNGAFDESFVFDPATPSGGVSWVKVYIDNSVGGYNTSTEQLYYKIFYTDGTVSSPDVSPLHLVTAGDLSTESGGQVSFQIGDLNGANNIDAVQFYMGTGAIKIPVIQFAETQTFSPNSLHLDFTGTITDGDSDIAHHTFSVDLAA